MKPERVVESLNRGLHAVLAEDPRVYLLGEDLLDPYGGAFKASRGLSTAFPDRVLTTPLSEQGFVGVGAGLALAGDRPIVEIMFGDFIALAFDPILNFATKSVSMYGHRVPMHLVLRCPVGGNRAYGATHSQSLQKHFVGIPDLELYELTPFDDGAALLRRLLSLGRPAILFENKEMYGQNVLRHGQVDELFSSEVIDDDWIRVSSSSFTSPCPTLLVTPGGSFARTLAAARRLFLELELECEILVPSRLYPFAPEPIAERVVAAARVFTIEEGTAGGSWGEHVAHLLHQRLWSSLRGPVRTLTSKDSIIPSAPHLERQVLVQTDDIFNAVRGA